MDVDQTQIFEYLQKIQSTYYNSCEIAKESIDILRDLVVTAKMTGLQGAYQIAVAAYDRCLTKYTLACTAIELLEQKTPVDDSQIQAILEQLTQEVSNLEEVLPINLQ